MNKKCQFCNMKVKIPTRITIARGDGIGPEIMDATLRIITAAGCAIETDEIIVGQVPQKLRPVEFKQGLTHVTTTYELNQTATKELVGVDVFICYANRNADELAAGKLTAEEAAHAEKRIGQLEASLEHLLKKNRGAQRAGAEY